MRGRVYKGNEHFLYESTKEFREYYPKEKILRWREGREGDWVRTSEKGIVQVLKYSESDVVAWVKTICGTFITDAVQEMTDEFVPNMHSFVHRDENWRQTKLGRKEPTSKEIVFVEYFVHSAEENAIERRTNAYLKAFAGNNRSKAMIRSALLFKTDRIRNLLGDKIKEAMEAKEVSLEYIIGEAKKAVEKEVGKGKITGLKFLAELASLGGYNKSVQQAPDPLKGAIPIKRIAPTDAEYDDEPKLLSDVREADDEGRVDAGTDEDPEQPVG